jgi:hypothetical protein
VFLNAAPEYIPQGMPLDLIRAEPNNVALLEYCIETFHWTLHDITIEDDIYKVASVQMLEYIYYNDFGAENEFFIEGLILHRRKDVFDHMNCVSWNNLEHAYLAVHFETTNIVIVRVQ